MFATDPSLYGATLPRRELPFMNPFFTQQRQMPWAMYGNPWSVNGQQQMPWPVYGQQQVPWSVYGQQQVPWSIYGQFPYSLPQTGIVPFDYTPIQHSYGMFGGQMPFQPFPQSFYNLPQQKLQSPWLY